MTTSPAILWITRARPFPPNFGGDWLYSSRMIAAVANAGAQVVVVCSDQGGPPPPGFPNTVAWKVAPGSSPGLNPALLLSPLPNIAARHSNAGIRQLLREALEEQAWDAVIIDHIGAAWALPQLLAAHKGRIVYLSHNHESSVRREVARNAVGPWWRRLAQRIDASKVPRLERRLVDASTLVGVNTDEDAAAFRRDRADRRYLVLLPGYDGAMSSAPDLSATPRNVLFLGSFAWVAKQANLLHFLEAARRRLDEADVGILVVGAMPEELRKRLAGEHPSVVVTGAVDDVQPWLRQARLGLLAEETGGGFKHKALSYVFAGLPIAALDGTYAGLPVRPGDSILSYADMNLLTDGILAEIDDSTRLGCIRDAALAACQGRFDWRERGEQFLAALAGSAA